MTDWRTPLLVPPSTQNYSSWVCQHQLDVLNVTEGGTAHSPSILYNYTLLDTLSCTHKGQRNYLPLQSTTHFSTDALSLPEHQRCSPPGVRPAENTAPANRLFLEAAYASAALPVNSTLKNDKLTLILLSKSRISQFLLPSTKRRKGQHPENCKRQFPSS